MIVEVGWKRLLLCFLFLMLSHLTNVLRWLYLQSPSTVNFTTLLYIYGAGLFVNNFLPTGMGGDGLRIILLKRKIPTSDALFSTILDRIFGFITLVGFLGLGVFFLPMHLSISVPQWIKPWGWAVSVIIGLVLGLVLFLRPSVRIKLSKKLKMIRLPHWSLSGWLQRLLSGFGLSVISQVFLIGSVRAALLAFDLSLPINVPMWLMILSSLSLFLPVTVNGLGIVEGIYVTVLKIYEIPATAALGTALLLRVAGIGISFLGGLALFNPNYTILKRSQIRNMDDPA